MMLHLTLLLLSLNLSNSNNHRGFTIEELPEYVVISVDTYSKTSGGRIIEIDGRRKSRDEEILTKLENYLRDKNRSGVRYHTDLLNEMSEIGYDFIQALREPEEDNYAKYYFRKKAKFRDQ